MNGAVSIDTKELMREIICYLAAVDIFRDERCEPTWLPEPTRELADPLGLRVADVRVSTA
jgi:hypothetical protein